MTSPMSQGVKNLIQVGATVVRLLNKRGSEEPPEAKLARVGSPEGRTFASSLPEGSLPSYQ